MVEQARISGREKSLPERALNPPQLAVGLQFYWDAFWTLGADRAIGMSEGPIPWTAVHTFALSRGMSVDESDRLYRIVRAMDVVYLNELNRKNKAEMDKASRGKGKSSGGQFIPKKR